MNAWDAVIAGNSLKHWLGAAGLAVGVALVLILVKRMAAALADRDDPAGAAGWRSALGLAAHRTSVLVLLLLAVRVASPFLVLSPNAVHALDVALTAALFIQAGLWSDVLVRALVRRWLRGGDGETANGAAVLTMLARAAAWSVVALLLLDNLGVNVTTLIAGLGVGGIALGLAAQNVLSDLFASLAILLDRPFKEGDVIVIGDVMGTVERIGIKTTRVRAMSQELLVFGNSDLLKNRIQNFADIRRRRAVQRVGVVYETPAAKLRDIPRLIQETIEGVPGATFDRAHFVAFGASSLDFEFVYFIENGDYPAMLAVVQAVGFALFERFEREGLVFAYPTQTLHLAGGLKIDGERV